MNRDLFTMVNARADDSHTKIKNPCLSISQLPLNKDVDREMNLIVSKQKLNTKYNDIKKLFVKSSNNNESPKTTHNNSKVAHTDA